MQRRHFIRLTGGGVVLAATAGLAGCDASLPAEALQAWSPPGDGGDGGDVRRWVRATPSSARTRTTCSRGWWI